jgi:phage anti-repressor protein
MTELRTIEPGNQLILANDFYRLLKTKDDFCSWLYNRITNLDMELNNDFVIFLPTNVIKELSKIESFKDERTRQLINELQ